MSRVRDAERVGKFKVRHFGRYIEKKVVYRDGDRYFITRGAGEQRVRPVEPPEDYPGRRSEGLIEFEAGQ